MIFIVYDLEATCWRGAPPNDVQEIIEIGAIKLNGFGEELGSFSRFVQPKVNKTLSAFCTELTGIEQRQVERAEMFPEVFELFWEWAEIDLQDYMLISWGKQDKTLWRNDCLLHDLQYEWLEPHLNLKKSYKNLKRLNKPTGLVNTLVREGMEFEGHHHRAIYDAYNTARIFAKYIDEWAY